jgi:hypothetical protein
MTAPPPSLRLLRAVFRRRAGVHHPALRARSPGRRPGRSLADGFVLMGTDSLDEFVTEVVPRLERKGIYDRRPDLTTFRSRLGQPAVPVSAESLAAA